MRRPWILVLLQLAAPMPAIAQQAPPPATTEETCAVPADRRWTAQEAFVWARVCAGADADFSRAPDYGGRLEAKSPEHWPDSRILSPSFLETILLKEPYRHALSRHGVAIVGARFAEPLDLSEAVLTCPLSLRASVFDKGLHLKRLKTDFSVELDGSNLKALDLNAAQLLRLSLRGVVAGDVNLAVARVAGNIQMEAGRFAGKVDLSGMHVGGLLFIVNSTELKSLSLANADIDKNVVISGVKVSDALSMNEMHVGGLMAIERSEFGDVDLRNLRVDANLFFVGSRAHGKMLLALAQVGKNLQFEQATLADRIDLGGIHVGGFLVMRDKSQMTDVNLVNSRVEKNLEIVGSNISGALAMNRTQVGGLLVIDRAGLGAVALRGAQVGELLVQSSKFSGPLDCRGMEVGGEGSLQKSEFVGEVVCTGATIKGDAALDDATFHKDVDLTKSEIGGALQLENTKWADDAWLRLANAKIGFIDLNEAWPAHVELDGLAYRSVDNPESYTSWFARLGRFAPQPYDQLASVVHSAGDDDLATTIRYSGRQRARHEESSWIGWGILVTLEGLIGFGYYPLRALIWVAVFIVLGVVVLRVTGEGPRNGMPWGVGYSFDLLLPIIRLRDAHYEIDLKGPARYYFYFHKIMGYLLASFVIAGVSGLTK